MAHPSSSIPSKDGLTFPNNYQESCNNCDSSLADQLGTVLKFDKRELKFCGFIDEIPLEGLKFFWDVILKKGSTINFTTDQLYNYFQKADPKIHRIIRNPKDMKDFLSKYSNLFTIDGENISLSNPAMLIEGHIKWIKTLLQNEYPNVSKTVINAIQFYSDILYDKEDYFPIDKLVTHRNKAKQDVQIIAINPLELKSFLIAYPQVFIVNEDKVSLTYSAACERSDYSWLGEMCGLEVKNPELRLYGKAVTYYLFVLFKQDVHQLPLSVLFTFQNLACKDIMELTRTMGDLRKFFVSYICVFQVNKNNVMIKDSLLINLKRDEVRLRGKKGSDLSTKEVIFMIQENLFKTALDACLRTIKNKLELKCSLEVSLKELLSELEYLFENVNDLKIFLSYHPNDFIIKDDIVLLRTCDNITDITGAPLKSKLSSLNKNVKPVYEPVLLEQVKDFCVNFLIQNVGVEVQFPLIQFKGCICLAPPELQQILNNEKDFRPIISRYPNVLTVTDNYILLKKSYNEPSFNLPKNKVNECLLFFVWILKEKVGVGTEFPIARLKIYLDVAPPEIKIPNILLLKEFLQKHPDIFIVNNNNVILKNLDDEKYSRNTRYEKLCYVESYSITEAIAFYSIVLNRFCSNLEVPIEHLFGYRSLAPIEVFGLAKSPSELKHFLSTHPDIFTIKENNVCLTKCLDRSQSNAEVCDDREALAVNFYSSILDRVSQDKEFPIVRLFGYQYLAPPEVRELINTPLELKDFLSKYSNVFYINNDIVLMKKSISRNKDLHFNEKLRQSGSFLKEVETTLSDLNLNPQSANKNKFSNAQNKILKNDNVNKGFISKKSSIIRSIRFYSNIMFKKGPNSEHMISNLLCFRNEATNEIKEVAKKPIELLTFLSKFPQIFTINSSKFTVILTDMVSFYKNERNWIKELLPKYHQSTTNHETVVSGIQFYVNHIFERGSQVLPIKSLFRYRKTAMGDVQTLANSANELKDFLSMYPEIFKISDEGVSLTSVAVSHKIEPKWIEEIIGDNHLFSENSKSSVNEKVIKRNMSSNNLSNSQNHDPSLKDANTLMAVNFFKSMLETEVGTKEMNYNKLFEYLNEAPQDVKESFKTPSELKDFFIKYSDIFTVKDNFVSLVRAKSDSKVKRKKKQRSVKKVKSSNSSVVVSETGMQNNPENSSQFNNLNSADRHLSLFSEEKNSPCNLVSTILFYSNIMWRKGPHLEHSIGSVFCHSSKASSIVKETVKNTKELKEFLSKYPQLFSVNHEKQTVTLSDVQAFHKNQRNWIRELLPEHHQSTANHEIIVSTIQFYSNILFEKSPKCEFPLSILFSHRNTAMEDVQMMVQNIKELNKFLSTFPDIFVINEDKVSLNDFVISQLKQPKWIEELVCGNESPVKNLQIKVVNSKENADAINEELLKKKKIAMRRAIQFYYKIMLKNVSNKVFSLSQLFDYLHEAPSDVQEVANSVTELRNFFSKYPHIFTIADDLVFLTCFNDK